MDVKIHNKIKLPLLKFCMIGVADFVLLVLSIQYLTFEILAAINAAALALSVLSILFKKNDLSLIFIAIFISTMIFQIKFHNFYEFSETIYAQKSEIIMEITEGTVDKVDYFYVRGNAEIKNKKMNIILYLKENQDINAGNIIAVKVNSYFSNNKNHLGNAIFVKAYASEKAEIIGNNYRQIKYLPQRIKANILKYCDKVYDGNVGKVILSLLTGDKDNLSSEIKNDFALSGTSHLMAVSGLHMSVALGFCIFIFGKKWGSLLGIPMIMIYWAVSGFSPSASRALIMSIIMVGGFSFRRDYHAFTAYFFSAFLILTFNPFAIYSISFQLSYLSVLGILVFMPIFSRNIIKICQKIPKIEKIIFYILSSWAISFSASIFTIPITMIYFDRISLISLISNLILIPPISFAIMLSFFNLIIFQINEIFAVKIGVYLIEPIIKTSLKVIEYLADLPFSSVQSESIYIFIGLMIILFCALIYLFSKKYFLILAMAGLISFSICYHMYFNVITNNIFVEIKNCDGVAVAYINDGNESILIGGGDGKKQGIIRFLESSNFKYNTDKLQSVFLSKMNKANILGAIKIKEKYGAEIYGSYYDRKPYPLKYIVYNDKEISMNNISVKSYNLPFNESVLELNIGEKSLLWLPSISDKRAKEYISKNNISADYMVISSSLSFDQEYVETILSKIDVKKIIIVNSNNAFWIGEKNSKISQTAEQGMVKLIISKGGTNDTDR